MFKGDEMNKFNGIIPAIITPFKSDGSLYIAGLKNELEYLYACGFKNLFICGSYGSFPLMNINERKTVCALCVEFCKEHNMKTIVQIGLTYPIDSMELAKHAEFMGADAISSVVPYYYSGSVYNDDTYIRYFETLINCVSIDVHYYNNTKTTNFNVSPNLLKKLMNIGLKGIKDGGSNTERILEILNIADENVDGSFDYYPSSTNSLLLGFLLGAKSCISGVSLSAPLEILEIYNLLKIGEIDKAIHIYKKVMNIRSLLNKNGARASAAYEVLKSKGVDVGTCRSPWKALNKTETHQLVKNLSDLEIAYEDAFLIDIHKQTSNVVVLDFDGVIHKNTKGYYNGTIYDEPVDGTREALEELAKKYKLVILTCKASRYRPLINGKTGKELIWNWLDKYDLSKYICEVTDKKPRALFYIDDKNLVFTTWHEVLNEINNKLEQN